MSANQAMRTCLHQNATDCSCTYFTFSGPLCAACDGDENKEPWSSTEIVWGAIEQKKKEAQS